MPGTWFYFWIGRLSLDQQRQRAFHTRFNNGIEFLCFTTTLPTAIQLPLRYRTCRKHCRIEGLVCGTIEDRRRNSGRQKRCKAFGGVRSRPKRPQNHLLDSNDTYIVINTHAQEGSSAIPRTCQANEYRFRYGRRDYSPPRG